MISPRGWIRRILSMVMREKQSIKKLTLEDEEDLGMMYLHTFFPDIDQKSKITEIDVWYGLGDRDPVGPLEAKLVKLLPNDYAEFFITDKGWLDHIGDDDPISFKARLQRSDGFVGNDSYAWSPKVEHSEEVLAQRWWRK